MKRFLYFLLLFTFIWSKTVFIHRFGGVAGMNLNNIVIYLIILLVLVFDFLTGRIREKQIIGLKIFVGIVTLLFFSFMYALINSHPGPDLITALQVLKRFYIDPLVLYVLACLLIDSGKEALNFLIIAVVLFSLFNIISLVFFVLGINFFMVQDHSLGLTERFAGFMGNSNKTSYLLSCITPFLFYLEKIQKGFIQKSVFWVLIVFNLLTIILSGSRGGMLSLLISVLILFVLTKEFKKLAWISVVSVIGIFYVLNKGYFFIFVERLNPLFKGEYSTSSAGRLDIWADLFRVYLSDAMIIMAGLGLGGAEYVGMKTDPHNFYLQILAEYGIIGFFLFILIILYFVVKISSKKSGSKNNFRFYLLSAWAVVLVGWVFSTFDGIMNYIMLIMGVSVSYLFYQNDSNFKKIDQK